MKYTGRYNSPLGDILLEADGKGLCGLRFSEQRHLGYIPSPDDREEVCPALLSAISWLDIYFSGRDPGFLPPLHMQGSDFAKEVWKILLEIPYGKTVSYGNIAKMIAKERGIPRMSAQAVGGAVGANPISIIIPCHRVVGADGSLTGYAGGLYNKAALLRLEGADIGGLFPIFQKQFNRRGVNFLRQYSKKLRKSVHRYINNEEIS